MPPSIYPLDHSGEKYETGYSDSVWTVVASLAVADDEDSHLDHHCGGRKI